ncbi:vitamin K-dependent protein Z [Gallus gallus]|uniref:vitamin K-dependent protein Z n=1 Tax=Gallus gallus TaxID=9031 RepID=UPI0000ECD5B8|nr:vitamin K-dependent protein Z [Gallus gallus]|eukprot:XP_416945.3 vitamin K-dependent protein Z [Gallus gallus]
MARCFWTVLFLLSALFLQTEQTVFISTDDANKVIKRHRRANSLHFEEVLQGSLERECLEERCTHEEAREVFENDEMLKMFWDNYYDGWRCSSSPCQHGGLCEDSIRDYTCTCTTGFEGKDCAFAKNECRHQGKEGCQHFCYPGSNSYHCSCADGYELGKDKKQCIPLDQCACGRLKDNNSLISETPEEHGKQFPWQVLLLNSEGKGFCGGVLLKSNFVLTTAECALLHNHFKIRVGAGHNRTSGAEKIMEVHEKHIHIRYDEDTGENDIALLQLQEHIECSNHQLPVCIPERDFAEHILIPKLAGTVIGWNMEGGEFQGDELQVSYLPTEDCEQMLNASLTNRQFCGHSQEAIDKQLAGGSFMATVYKGTWFLTGILGPWPLEDADRKTFLFTNTARYMIWFKQKMR